MRVWRCCWPLTDKEVRNFTQEVEGGLTNFKKVLVFSSDCCWLNSALRLWKIKISLSDELASRWCRWVSLQTCSSRMWLGWQNSNATSAKASPQQACPHLLKEKRPFTHLKAWWRRAEQSHTTLHWKQLLKFNLLLLKLWGGAMRNMSQTDWGDFTTLVVKLLWQFNYSQPWLCCCVVRFPLWESGKMMCE